MMTNRIAIVVITGAIVLSPVHAGVDFKSACLNWSGNRYEQFAKIKRVNAIHIAEGFKKTVKIGIYHYSIHDDNPYIFDVAKAAHLTNAFVSVCLRSNNATGDELVGIELGNQ
ncbi:hypothetical protein AAH678_27045 [Sodalis endosymbiont of Spalangia cameroni]